MSQRRSFLTIWGLVIAWCAAVAGVVAAVLLSIVIVPGPAWPVIGFVALGLGFTAYVALIIWIGDTKGDRK